ncbi:MAG TPA: pyruvate kinase [Patescibacteria group bacterium]|nr:pyruvate kinase [Patescibacteria group bacterium]
MPRKRTKIVCTIGPASDKLEILEKMVEAGMNVARLNFSHGTHEYHAGLIKMLRELAAKTGEPIAILQDLQGPKIRVGELPKEGVMLTKDASVTFSTDPKAELPKISVTYEKLHEDVKPGDVILLDDGLIDVRVEKVEGRDIICRVANGGPLTSHKGFNLPTATLSVPAITDKDKEDLKFGVAQHVDWVALSFVRNAKEIYDLRYMIKDIEAELGGDHAYESPIRIVAKIEKHEALKNIDEIVEAVDGIMVARGDLGIETPAEDVPLWQKRLIDKCLHAAKPVIVATQMLDSMIRNPRPTRAEVSDIANAVIDHTDAIMLSGETASGKFPVGAVETMSKVVLETEESKYDDLKIDHVNCIACQTTEVSVSQAATVLAKDVGAKLVLVASMSGDTGRIVSRYRPELPILVATDSERVRHQLNLSWGVVPFILPRCRTVEELVDRSVGHLKKEKLVQIGDKIIVIAGEPVGSSGGVNLVEIREIK